jgi:hypothetical protein
MQPKKFLAVVVVTSAFMWVVAGLWHNLVLPSLDADKEAHHEGIGVLLVAYVVLSGLMVFLYERSTLGRRPLIDGFMFGAVIGVLWVFPHELAMAGAHQSSVAPVLKNGLWHMLEQGLGGALMGFVSARATTPP